ncbi:MAG: DUF465 domain-containing protein [Alphaproteobacteria bacterium]|nr:DUF465 domain-containing protein [Alphaproteobacteria bacterium]
MDEEELKSQLLQVEQEHRDLDDSIQALMEAAHVDHLQIQRLKRRKLWLKDEIVRLRDQLTPDIIA